MKLIVTVIHNVFGLFVSQRQHRIDAHGALCRKGSYPDTGPLRSSSVAFPKSDDPYW